MLYNSSQDRERRRISRGGSPRPEGPVPEALLRRACRLLLVALSLLCLLDPPARAEDYRLDAGDLLRVSVYGEPGYPMEVRVNAGGSISLPLIGDIPARGQSVNELVAATTEAFRQREFLREPLVQVEVAEYRPFFIAGAVAEPGAYPYKPRMLVRHALAIAGGFKAIKVGDKASSLAIADLRSEQVDQVIEIFRYKAQLERLKAELQDREKFAAPTDIPNELSAELVAEILASEETQLRVRRANFESQLAELEAVVAEARREIESISEAQSKKKLVISDQLQEVETARTLKLKGFVKNSDLLSALRGYNNYLAELALIEGQGRKKQQDVLSLEGDIEKLKAARKVEIISQMQDAQVAIAKAQNKVSFILEQVTFVSTYGEHRSLDDLRGAVRISIHRPKDGGIVRLSADEDTLVEPGDILDVSIQVDKEYYGGKMLPAQ